MHLPGLHHGGRIGAAVQLIDLVAHRFAEVGITSFLRLVSQRGHVCFFAELDRDLPAGILQEALSATAGNLLKVEPFVVSGLKKRDTRQNVVIFRAFTEQDDAARMNRLTARGSDESLVSNRLLVEVEHLRLAERLGLAIVIPFGNCQLRLPCRDKFYQR